MLGSGPMEGKILDWAKTRGWSDRVRIMLARHDEVPSYLGTMDMLVAPSQTTCHWKEQFGRMLIEAFACGVPVIGSDSGEIPYVIGDAGRVVGEKDVLGWAAAIIELLDRPDLHGFNATRPVAVPGLCRQDVGGKISRLLSMAGASSPSSEAASLGSSTSNASEFLGRRLV